MICFELESSVQDLMQSACSIGSGKNNQWILQADPGAMTVSVIGQDIEVIYTVGYQEDGPSCGVVLNAGEALKALRTVNGRFVQWDGKSTITANGVYMKGEERRSKQNGISLRERIVDGPGVAIRVRQLHKLTNLLKALKVAKPAIAIMKSGYIISDAQVPRSEISRTYFSGQTLFGNFMFIPAQIEVPYPLHIPSSLVSLAGRLKRDTLDLKLHRLQGSQRPHHPEWALKVQMNGAECWFPGFDCEESGTVAAELSEHVPVDWDEHECIEGDRKELYAALLEMCSLNLPQINLTVGNGFMLLKGEAGGMMKVTELNVAHPEEPWALDVSVDTRLFLRALMGLEGEVYQMSFLKDASIRTTDEFRETFLHIDLKQGVEQ